MIRFNIDLAWMTEHVSSERVATLLAYIRTSLLLLVQILFQCLISLISGKTQAVVPDVPTEIPSDPDELPGQNVVFEPTSDKYFLGDSVSGLDNMEVFEVIFQLKDVLQVNCNQRTTLFWFHTVSKLFQFYTNPNLAARVLILWDYAQYVKDNGLLMIVTDVLTRLCRERDPSFETRELGVYEPTSLVGKFCDFVDSTARQAESFHESQFSVSMSKLFALAIAYGAVDGAVSSKLLWAGLVDNVDVARWEKGHDVPSLVTELLTSVSSLLKTVFQPPTSSTAFVITNPYSFFACYRWLKEYEFRRYPVGSTPVEGMVSDALWRQNLSSIYDSRTSVRGMSMSDKLLYSSVVKNVIEMKVRASSSDYSGRPLPFNIGLMSPPGVGKSTWIVPSFVRTALRGLGIDPPDNIDDVIATVTFSDKYLSQYRPEKHLAVFIDEMGSANPKNSSESAVMSEITQILGEGEYYPSKADVSEKGKVSFRSFVNVCCSNSEDFGVGDYITNVNAFRRRFSVVFKVKIRPEFQKVGPNGEALDGIDHTKIPEGSLDAVLFKAYVGGPSGFMAVVPREDDGWVSFSEARDYIFVLAKNHHSKTLAVDHTRTKAAQIESSEVCTHGLLNCPECSNCSASLRHMLSGVSLQAQYVSTSGTYSPTPLPVRLSAFEQTSFLAYDAMTYLFFLVLWFFFWCIYTCSADRFRIIRVKYTAITSRLKEIRHDMVRVDTLLKRVNHVLNRYERVQLRTVGALSGALVLVLGFLALRRKSRSVPYSPTAELAESLRGSPPPIDSDFSGNPWTTPKGFYHLGKGSSMPKSSMLNRLTRNVIEVVITPVGEEPIRTHLTGVKDQYAVGVWHSLRHMLDPRTTLSVLYHRVKEGEWFLEQIFSMRGGTNVVTHLGNDVGLIVLADISAFKDITNVIPVKAQYVGEMQKVVGFNVFYSREGYRSLVESSFAGVHGTIKVRNPDGTLYDVHALVGKGSSDPFHGQCGSPLVLNIGSQMSLAAINCAANLQHQSTAFAPLSMESLNAGILALSTRKSWVATSSVGVSDNSDLATHVTPEGSSRNHVFWLTPSEMGGMHFRGSFGTAITRKPKTKVVDMPLRKILFEIFPPEYYHNLVAPQFSPVYIDSKYVSPEKNALLEMGSPVTGISPESMDLAIQHFVSKISAVDFSRDQVVDLYTAINGSRFSPFIGSIPRSTSAGWPDGGKKYDHLITAPSDQSPDGLAPTKELKERVEWMISEASQGRRTGVVYKTCLKDEPRDADKVAHRKIRLFTLGPMAALLACKMYYGMFMGIFISNCINVETVGGLNCFSPTWGEVFSRLSRFPNVINGDFSKFDKKSSVYVLMSAFSCIIHVKRAFGDISREVEAVLVTLASEVANPLIMLDRDVIEVPGSLSSGVYLTFLINNIVNSLYIRLAWMHCYTTEHGGTSSEAIAEFSNHVEFFAMGDDNTFTVSDEAIRYFNFRTVQAYFKSIGLKYTNAAKTDDVYGSLSLSEATICKRKWVFDEEFDLWCCPLEKPSIMKMLTIGIQSDSVSLPEQQSLCIDSALAELAQWGREEYDSRISDLRSVLPDKEFPSYDSLKLRQKEYGLTPWVPYTVDPPSWEFHPTGEKTKTLSCDEFANQLRYMDTTGKL